MKSLAVALTVSSMLYMNWKCVKKLYANQFNQIIEPYRREIQRKCEQQNVNEITAVLNSILSEQECALSKKDFILYSAAAADIILERKMPSSTTSMPMASRN